MMIAASSVDPATRRAVPLAGALAGLAAGLAAAFAVKQFEKLWCSLAPVDAGDKKEPPNDGGGTRRILRHCRRTSPGGNEGIFGTAFGSAVALVLENVIVPVAGLGDPPWKSPLRKHVRGLASHLVFGIVVEGVRSRIRNADFRL